MRRLVMLALLLLSVPAQGAIVYVWDTGSATVPYDTWAKAATTLNLGVQQWTTSDVVYVEDSHSETQGGSMSLAATGDTALIPIPIYSVDNTDDSYSPAAATQVAVTNSTSDINFGGHWRIFGMRFSAKDNILMPQSANGSFHGTDLYLILDGNGSFIGSTVARVSFSLKNSTIDFTDVNGGYLHAGYNDFLMEGVTIAGDARAGGLFYCASSVPSRFTCIGCDLSAMSGETLLDASATSQSTCILTLVGSKIPSSVTLHDSGFDDEGQYVWVTGTDPDGASDGQSFRQELHNLRGSVITDTATYRDAGLAFTEDSANASLKFTAASNVSTVEPLCSWKVYEWINSTGSTTITTEVRENFTTALTDEQFWQEVFYLGTTNSAMWTLDNGQDLLAGSSLTTSSETWTESMTGDRGAKVATTVTINKAGLYAVRYCLGAFESGKELYVDADPTVS